MWIVKIALKRPYTFIVLALLILLISPLVIHAHAHRHFPQRQHPGRRRALELHRPERRGDGRAHRHRRTSARSPPSSTTSSTSNRRPSTAAASSRSFSIPDANVDMAMAQMTAVAQTAAPADAARHHAAVHAGVQRLQRADPATGAFRQRAVRAAAVRLRRQLHPHRSSPPCRARPIPWPYGGKQRQVMIDLQPALLQAKGLSPADVVNAVSTQNLILPAGTSKIGAVRIRRRSERQPRDAFRSSTIFRSRPSATPPSTCTTWRTCATAFRRRPTSSAATASAARC